MKKILLFLFIGILIIILLLTGTRFKWNTTDEWKGPVIQTCEFTGIWNASLHLRFTLMQKCSPI